MRILITNDDGIRASQLPALVQWARTLGEVTVVAPEVEQSGKSQGINIHDPFTCKRVDLFPGVVAWSVDSTPADCVRFAVLGKGMEFDLVISGINRGLNIGSDILYSGTVAAIFEAQRLGIRAMALSTQPACYDRSTEHLDSIWQFVCRHDLLSRGGPYNINIPSAPKGIRITRQGGPYYSDDFIPVGGDLYQAQGKPIFEPSGDPELDTDSTLGGYITITPLTLDRTNHALFQSLRSLNA